jgi:hypothetical protein
MHVQLIIHAKKADKGKLETTGPWINIEREESDSEIFGSHSADDSQFSLPVEANFNVS